jgi:outer membrane protein assembly factor BamB
MDGMPNPLTRALWCACLALLVPAASVHAAVIDKSELLSAGQIHGGLAVHLGCSEEGLLAAFAKDSRFIAQGLARDESVVRKLRSALESENLYGKVSVILLDGERLPYNDQLVRYLIVEDALGIPDAELKRVLCPGGVLARRTADGWSTEVQPWPKSLDEWTHVRHGADGNVVSRDSAVGSPTNVRWIADSPPTSSMSQKVVIVSAAGRLFSVIGERAPVLYARDAFSGILLWQRPYAVKLKSFRHRAFWNRSSLIALGDRVYVQGGALDAATGEPVFRFDGNPVVCAAGVLITSEMQAMDASSGSAIWRHPRKAEAVVVGGEHLFLVEGEWPVGGGPVDLVCLDLKSGDERWRRPFLVPEYDAKPSRYDGYAPNTTPNGLLVGMAHHRGVLALEVSRTYVHLLSAADGHHLRSIRYKNWSPYAAGLRALMIDGRLWLPEHVKGESFDYGLTINAYDLNDGKLARTLKLATPVRQRCRPPLASAEFMYLGGMNAVDLKDGASEPMPIARSACGIGVVPANGLIYAPPTHCRCYSMIGGYVALESRGRMGVPLARANSTDHLRRGPAYGKVSEDDGSGLPPALGWPTLRQDSMRRAHVELALPEKPGLVWTRQIPGAKRLGAPVIAGTTLVVADAERHRVEALDTKTGEPKWSFVADGPVLGAPTIAGGLCVFGCRDGWVYALRFADGVLAWRNLVAPETRQIIASGQLESAWPALSTVTVAKGTVCAVAGRHNMAEAGIVMTGLDLVSGKKKWQMTPEHRPKDNLLTAGAYARKSLPPDPRSSSAAVAGWIVCDGKSVQIDRLGAADIVTGEVREHFDTRLESQYTGTARRLKDGTSRADFEQWFLSAGDGEKLISYDQKALQFQTGDEKARFKAPGKVRSLASTREDWVILTEGALLLVDKRERRVRATVPFEGTAIRQGLAIAHGRIFVVSDDGRVLCVAAEESER